MSGSPFGVKLVAAFYGIGGAASLVLGAVVVFAGYTFSLSTVSLAAQAAIVPQGVFGLAVFGAIGAVPLLLGVFMLLLAVGLWHGKAWALWSAVGLEAMSLLLFLGLFLLAGTLGGVPLVGAYFSGPMLPSFGGAAVSFAAMAYLLVRRDEFK